MHYPRALQNLISKLAHLPGVGPKTAERYAFYLLSKSEDELKELSDSILNLKKEEKICHQCFAWTESDPCEICADANRSSKQLCIVENIQDLIAIEQTGQYKGKYFVLGGLISMIDKIGPQDLNISALNLKIKKDKTDEIIIALNFTLEGETTSLYLQKLFKDRVKISRLAKGLPAGSDLEYADLNTLKSALQYRSEIK
ncbi:recombination protein RecR [Candidatus Falkowbacteria bacterium]|nr:recombination protein RecR [Candidatus Falkowbacteria bacterium]